MEETYFNLVINHRRTCDENNASVKLVPVSYIERVKELLLQRGYDNNGFRLEE